MVNTILVGVAGTRALPCKIFHAIELAKLHRATISVLAIVNTEALRARGPVPIGASLFATRITQKRVGESVAADERAVDRFIQEAEAADVPVEARFAEGDPFEELQKRWHYADTLMMSLRGWFDHGLVPEPEDARAVEADMIVMGGRYRRFLLAQRFGRAMVDMIKRSQLPLFISH